MKNTCKYYYAFLGFLVLSQVLMTVFNLSQNIAYGQKISYLENQKNNLTQEKIQLKKDLSNQVAIRVLEAEGSPFENILDVTVVESMSDSLALK